MTRVLATFDRDQLAGFIAVAIDLLDLADGDLDIEPNGDELDGSMGEDDFNPHSQGIWALPGCPVSDPGEEDDPSGQCDEDGINTELFNQWGVGAGCTISDPGGDHANEDNPDGPMQQVDTGPGCPLSDEDHDDPAMRAGHRKRIQRTRCLGRYRYYRDWRSGQVLRELAGYELLRYPIIPSRRSLLRRKRGMPRRPRA